MISVGVWSELGGEEGGAEATGGLNSVASESCTEADSLRSGVPSCKQNFIVSSV
jgi:hypothetical protein